MIDGLPSWYRNPIALPYARSERSAWPSARSLASTVS